MLKIYDPRECSIPDVGLVHIKDSESGEAAWVNSSSRKVRDAYALWFASVRERENALFNRYQVDNVDISTDQDYVKRLMLFFNKK